MWHEVQADIRALDALTEEFRADGARLADAEARYRKEVAVAMLEERSEGTPVTIIRDVLYIRKAVYAALVERNNAQAVYDADKEAINALKLKIKVTNSQIEREWEQARRG